MNSNNEQLEKTILAIGHQIYECIRLKDIESLSQFLAADFIQRGADGTEASKEEFLRAISDLPVQMDSVSGEHEHVSIYGDVAIMTGVQRAEWRQGDEVHGVSSVAFVDVFERRGETWLLIHAFGCEMPG